ncbi:MAG: DNA repair protein RecN [Clostridia bacterium]|nr:DNA repair protein RecN [Clostridia bacterium]
MLYSLHVENLAVIKCADIDFSKGFSALTGETGAGKSVMIGGISLLLGAKAEKELIRTGEAAAMVSGLFGGLRDSAIEKLDACGVYPDEEGNILVQRTLQREGPSQVRMNGRSVSLSVLRAVMPALINIHGQHDTHTLSDPATHLPLLDAYAENEEYLKIYREHYEVYEKRSREGRALVEKLNERERRMEMLRYQIADIDAVDPHEGEEEELVDRKVKLKSSERILKNTDFVFRALKGSEKGSASYLLERSATALSQLTDVIPSCTEYSERLRDMVYQISDIAEEVYAIKEELEADGQDDINDIEARLDAISKLKRKYGLTVSDVLAFRASAAEELASLENADERIFALEKEKKAAYDAAVAAAAVLHERRTEAARRLETQIKDTLRFLDMPKVIFFASLKEDHRGGEVVLLPDGTDRVEFYISANSGADAQPMSKIASGGELARIMLALTCALADKQSVSTLIFDEIDAGVSGKTARKIGMRLRDLSRTVQVICVTHSAQIASLSETHYLIKKGEEDGRTQTRVCSLDEAGRIEELSRILGGLRVSAAQREAARDMLHAADASTWEDVATD